MEKKQFFSVLFPEQLDDLLSMGVAKIRTVIECECSCLCSFQIALTAVVLGALV